MSTGFEDMPRKSRLDGIATGDMGLRLKHLRIYDCDMTQQAFARQLGVSPQTVSNWESGKSKPGFHSRYKICLEFGVTIPWLLTGATLD